MTSLPKPVCLKVKRRSNNAIIFHCKCELALFLVAQLDLQIVGDDIGIGAILVVGEQHIL